MNFLINASRHKPLNVTTSKISHIIQLDKLHDVDGFGQRFVIQVKMCIYDSVMFHRLRSKLVLFLFYKLSYYTMYSQLLVLYIKLMLYDQTWGQLL